MLRKWMMCNLESELVYLLAFNGMREGRKNEVRVPMPGAYSKTTKERSKHSKIRSEHN